MERVGCHFGSLFEHLKELYFKTPIAVWGWGWGSKWGCVGDFWGCCLQGSLQERLFILLGDILGPWRGQLGRCVRELFWDVSQGICGTGPPPRIMEI